MDSMRGVIARVGSWVCLGCFSVAAAQLPPNVLVDQYLLRADRLMEANETQAALGMMGMIIALQQEHGLTLPDEFHFKYAKVAFSAGLLQDAKDSVNRYLTVAGRESNFYGAALELSLDIAELEAGRIPCTGRPRGSECWIELENQPKRYVWTSYYQPYETLIWTGEYFGNLAHGKGTIKRIWDFDQKLSDASPSWADDPKCTPKSKHSSCWTELTGQPECHVWNTNPKPNETLTWTGGCSGGRAHGEGTLTWISDKSKKTQEGKGSLQYGEIHGQWIWRNVDGSESTDFYVYGERVGSTAEGEEVMEGRLVKGKLQGDWVHRHAEGNVTEGPYVNGRRHGNWVWRDKHGEVTREGSYAKGKRQGNWVERFANGDVSQGSYEEGERHGIWIFREKNGTIEGVYFENGSKRNS